MSRVWKFGLILCVLFAVTASAAVAKSAPPKRAGLDPGFGRRGKTYLKAPGGDPSAPIEMATAPSGKSYVLDGSLLFAFGANGRLDRGFAGAGLTQVTANGETTATDLAVDSQGRVLVTGYFDPMPGAVQSTADDTAPFATAFVIRYLPDGTKDPSFGGAGEIDLALTFGRREGQFGWVPHLGSPVVEPDRIAIVGGDQPIVGGTLRYFTQSYGGPLHNNAFVAWVDPTGPATAGPTAFFESGTQTVSVLAPTPSGDVVALSGQQNGCCEVGVSGPPTSLSLLGRDGRVVEGFDATHRNWAFNALAVDTFGRILALEQPEYLSGGGTSSPWKLVRLGPEGVLDQTFGSDGGMTLARFGEESVAAVAIQANGRAVVAGGDDKFRLVRVGTGGKIDHSFGKGGWIEVGFAPDANARPEAIAVDSKGRTVVAGRVGEGIGLARILPGK